MHEIAGTPSTKTRSPLRLAGAAGVLGASVAVAWLVPAMAQPGSDASQAPSTIVGNVVGSVSDLGALRTSIAVSARESAAGSLSTETLSAPSSSPPAVVAPRGVVAVPFPSTAPSGPSGVQVAPASDVGPSARVVPNGPQASPSAQPAAVAPAQVAQGGSSVGIGSSNGGGGGDSSTAVNPTAKTGDTGGALSESSSSNSGDTGDATSSAISNPSSTSGGSGGSGNSGSTDSTPSVTNSGTL